MKKAQFFISLILLSVLILGQAFAVYAAPTRDDGGSITGAIQQIEIKTDTNTGVTTVFVTVKENNRTFRVQLSLEAALLHSNPALLSLDGDGNPIINADALGETIDIDPTAMIVEAQHPVGSALATFFGVEYDDIMTYHESGNGFGVLTQVLWLTRNIAGDDPAEGVMDAIFADLMMVKNGELTYAAFYSNYVTNEDGTPIDEESIPTNWGQFRKALLADDKKVNLGAIMSEKSDEPTNTLLSNQNHGNGRGNGSGNGNGNGNGNNNGNGHGNENGNSNNGNGNGARP